MVIVGKDVVRLDGEAKVRGTARYVDDIDIPGMWHGAVVRSPIPHGRIKGVSFDPAFDWSSVVVADSKDIPGRNCVAMIKEDVPLLASDVVMHIGEAIILIAAPTREQALVARRHVRVEYEELKPVLTIDDSKSAKVKIFGDDNVISHYTIKKGDAKKGFATADRVVEAVYTMGHQEHMYIETQGMIAEPRVGGGYNVIGSIQCPYYVSKAISIMMDMPESAFAVRQAVVGGAFGGKEDYPSLLAGYCLVLARKAKRPVKIIYDRDEDTEATTKRHPARVRHKTGVAKDGTLVAMEIEVEFDAGAYTTLTPVVLSRGIIHSSGPYRCENFFISGTAYATNTPPNGAFRGFGAPQTCFPVEAHMDLIARELGMSPLDLRKKNMLVEGDITATGQRMDNSIATKEVLAEAAKRSGFEKRREELKKKSTSSVRRGLGMSLFFHGGAFTGSGEEKIKGLAGLRLDPDGKITVLTACTEMGQGAHTVLPQMAADHLGVDIGCIGIETPDTSLVPNSGPTVASRTTMIMGMVLGKCAAKLKEVLFSYAAEKYSAPRDSFSLSGASLMKGGACVAGVADLLKSYLADKGELKVIEHYDLPPGIKWDDDKYCGDAYPTFSWACDVAEVEVDMDTFEVVVKKMWLVQDIGKAINPRLAEGQIEGGTLQALGYGTMERHETKGGRFMTNRFQTYIIPTFADAPEMETHIVERPYKYGPMGAKGLGEMPMDGGAPAIINAIADATGMFIRDLPATPEKLLEAWMLKREGT
jgi:CO/xanthine dehydrogenase Mo-binding subunit